MQEQGTLSIHSENFLPIIKKWLYSDSDIFVREMISNAADAITKLKKLVDLGDAPHIAKDEKYAIHVTVDEEQKIIQFEDNGIGMTAEEIKEYITQIAFSGATDFLDKYKDKLDPDNEIIGHFGLGFYSVFMVADKVQIDSLSYKEGAAPARWVCSGGVEYELSDSGRTERGTLITLYVGDDGKDFAEQYKIRSVLHKYCDFIPVEIYLEAITAEKDKKDKKDDKKEEPAPINDTFPLWLKPANDCTDEEYKKFYHKVFTDMNDPLFWMHLNMDYPFRLKGILYFPKLKHDFEYIDGQVKLYNNQVFIADNIKEVIPEFLLLLRGMIDCPDLPLNVSRSFLQSDGYVNKMAGYITRKVADKLNSLCKKDRDAYNGYWEDISPFIKFGVIRDKDFYEKIKDAILYKTTSGDFVTLAEFRERNGDKLDGNKVYFVSNEQQQAQYVKMFQEHGLEALIMTSNMDSPYITYAEMWDGNVQFLRIDSDLSNVLKNTEEKKVDKKFHKALESLFQTTLGNEKLKVQTENLKSESVPAIILLSEEFRRQEDWNKMMNGGMLPMVASNDNEAILVLNAANPLVKTLCELKGQEGREEDTALICQQLYDLAMMSHKPLSPEQMTRFIERSNKILERIAG